ncbi:hypothetical protein U9M48_019592 [Paspalum notatum var. saurae]|uniref:Reverse transcriptase Ty1/copia-type domain-containing protein n=1 Tax=Paspalum notatum var. saurae TaxID=547442 RepID=A0AAQ3WQV6_PASNO
MEEEYAALLANQTWDLIPCPSGGNVVTGKWIWTYKRRADGTLDRYKARWVLQGFTRRPGVDYDETFSPVVKPATVRTVLSGSLPLVACAPAGCEKCISPWQTENAFLHGRYQAAGFVDPSRPEMVCRLNESLYSLKQAPRAWYSRFAMFLPEFAMKDFGVLHHFLVVTVESRPSGLLLHQRQYALDILERAAMTDCNPGPSCQRMWATLLLILLPTEVLMVPYSISLSPG